MYLHKTKLLIMPFDDFNICNYANNMWISFFF